MAAQPRLNDFVLADRLGSGTYAVVYKAYRKNQKREVVALKCVKKSTLSKQAIENLLTEISIMKKIKHEYIVEMKDFQWDDNYIYIIMEYCSGGDLSHYIKRKRRLPEIVVKQFLQQLATGFHFLRSHNIAHMDLKPQNILLSNHTNPVLKIADFGFAQYMQDKEISNSMRGSPLYMAPEILNDRKYDARVDLWSIGVVLYECLFGQAPFSSKSLTELADKIKSNSTIQIPYGVNISEECRDMVLKLLKRDPDERIDFESFFQHPFVDLEHMATPQSFAQGTKLATEAVKKDMNNETSESIQLYCEALLYLVPHIHAEADACRKVTLRHKVHEYMKRAEELKNGQKLNCKHNCDTSHKLQNFYSDDPKLMASLKVLKHAESLEEQDKYKEAKEKYELGLESLMQILCAEPAGAKKALLQKQVNEWLKKAENVKSYLSLGAVQDKSSEMTNSISNDKLQCAIQ